MASSSYTQQFEELSMLIKVIALFFLGGIISPVYRILRYTETKNTTTLIVAVLALFTGGFFGVLPIVDIVTEVTDNKIKVLAD